MSDPGSLLLVDEYGVDLQRLGHRAVVGLRDGHDVQAGVARRVGREAAQDVGVVVEALVIENLDRHLDLVPLAVASESVLALDVYDDRASVDYAVIELHGIVARVGALPGHVEVVVLRLGGDVGELLDVVEVRREETGAEPAEARVDRHVHPVGDHSVEVGTCAGASREAAGPVIEEAVYLVGAEVGHDLVLDRLVGLGVEADQVVVAARERDVPSPPSPPPSPLSSEVVNEQVPTFEAS